ncbi:MAG TPA: hypothetical protein VNZ53_60410, partial [Steroidobacteraceae bacterium]|nr:hypothetical protein [Steroidobacteraceae bacterium]
EGWVLAKIRYDDRGLAHAPRRLHDEVYVDYNDMIYAALPAEIEQRRQALLRKWRLKCYARPLLQLRGRAFRPRSPLVVR